eukprot:1057780-Pelagomonas_calceolata.AAC.1
MNWNTSSSPQRPTSSRCMVQAMRRSNGGHSTQQCGTAVRNTAYSEEHEHPWEPGEELVLVLVLVL